MSDPSATYVSAGWTGFGLQLVGFFAIAGLSSYLWWKTTDKEILTFKGFWRQQYWRRVFFFMIAWMPAFISMFMFVGFVSSYSKIWILRVTNTYPAGFTSCDESLVNRGICATYYLPIFIGFAVTTNNVLWGQFLRLKMWLATLHVFSGAILTIGLVCYDLVDDGEVQWIWLGVAALGAFLGWGIHAFSMLESLWYGNRGQTVVTEAEGSESKNYLFPDDPLFRKLTNPDKGTLTRGPYGNSVNYKPFSTAEGWINFFAGVIFNFGVIVVLFLFIGPEGLKQYTIGSQIWLFVAITVIYNWFIPTLQIIFWSVKTKQEVYAIGEQRI